ncbi:alcohol dehydrogenase catalytic domain-containing protein [Rhizobium sp. RCAM05350]|nr:alcohol dehydrogenase catalytic domain-containing protein [Rhizobium sp. RCAM05350]
MFSDFAFGLTESWFARTQAVEFPIGKLATVTQWQKDLTDLGLRNISIEDRELSHGNIITVEAQGGQFTETTQAADAQPAEIAVPVLVLHEDSVSSLHNKLPSGKDAIQVPLIQVQLTGDFDADKNKIAEAIEGLNEKPVRTVYLSSPTAADRSQDPAALQSRVLSLSAFAEALRQYYAHAEPAADQRPRLVIAAPGGAPVTATARDKDVSGSSVNSGLWAFARVLQNEYDFLDVHSLDFTGPKAGAGNQLAAAISLIGDASTNREWLLDATSGILSEIRAVPGPVDQSLRKTTEFKAATIRQRVSSQVGSIAWEQSDIPQAGPDDVVVAVVATGLNFHDVMWAMGLLPEEALEDGFAGATIGMELSGHVVAIGSGVRDLSVGDAVMAIAPAAFSTHVVVSRSGVARLPETVSPVAGSNCTGCLPHRLLRDDRAWPHSRRRNDSDPRRRRRCRPGSTAGRQACRCQGDRHGRNARKAPLPEDARRRSRL